MFLLQSDVYCKGYGNNGGKKSILEIFVPGIHNPRQNCTSVYRGGGCVVEIRLTDGSASRIRVSWVGIVWPEGALRVPYTLAQLCQKISDSMARRARLPYSSHTTAGT